MSIRYLALACCVALPTTVSAATFTLDFADATFADFGSNASNLNLNFDSVATVNGDVINAQLSAVSPWLRNNTSRNESDANAVQVNAQRGETVQFSLTLFADGLGDGYTSTYNPGTSFDWAVTFLDLDGTTTTWDQVLIRSEGTAEVAQDTLLNIEQTADGVLFSGEDTVGNVSNDISSGTLTGAQQQHAVRFTVENTSSIIFDYTSVTTVASTSGRNLILGSGSFSIDDPDLINVAPAVVPLPASAPLMLAGLGAFFALRRRKG